MCVNTKGQSTKKTQGEKRRKELEGAGKVEGSGGEGSGPRMGKVQTGAQGTAIAFNGCSPHMPAL